MTIWRRRTADIFFDGAEGDLHLAAGASAAIDAAVVRDDTGLDLDGEGATVVAVRTSEPTRRAERERLQRA